MAQRLTKNSFEGGLNVDMDKSKLDPIFATEIHNLETIGDGKFYNLTNIKGTINVQDVINTASTEVLGVFRNKYVISSVLVDCLTIMTASVADGFKIFCYDIENDTLYTLYTESIAGDYLTEDRVIDAVGYSENGIDYLYFTDNYNEPRVIRCEAPATLTSSDLSLARRGANGKISINAISTGGSLLSGSYQFSYRMVNPLTKKFTKWGSLTNPIFVFDTSNTSGLVHSGIGVPTTFKIVIDITPTTQETTDYTHFQLAVVENVYPLAGENVAPTASLLPIEVNGNLSAYPYKSNTKIGTIPIEDIVVDLSPIRTSKTLSVKQKRLFLGNITYHDMLYDNGDPIITSGSVSSYSTARLYSSHSNASRYVGYFRDEVYRFGIVYYDKYGNKSPVKVLNLNGVTGNTISGTLQDMRFPKSRPIESNGNVTAVGLSLVGIKNHPSWAVKFEIVRAKRKKRILTQTPLIPMTYIEGIGALDEYPSLAITGPDISIKTEYPNATPQTSSRTYVPKDLLRPDLRAIKKSPVTGSGTYGSGSTLGNTLKKGEAVYESSITGSPYSSLFMIFPQGYMYGAEPFALSGNETMEVVSYAKTKVNIEDWQDIVVPVAPIPSGLSVNTKVSAVFYATGGNDYYTASLPSAKCKISEYKVFDNLSQTDSLAGKSIMNYSDLQTKGVSLGSPPSIQKCAVINVPNLPTGWYRDIMGAKSVTFPDSVVMNQKAGGVPLFSSDLTLKYETDLTNNYINSYTGFSNKSDPVQAFQIVNITNDYGDDRYGEVDTQHEFISTGTVYSLSAAEVSTNTPINITVYGGDCFIGRHTFKVSDGGYSISNVSKGNISPTTENITTLIKNWGQFFFNVILTRYSPICLPIGLDGAAQFVSVYLESEYNGEVMDDDTLVYKSTDSNGPVVGIQSADSIHTPLTYNYNINISKQNSEKVFFTLPSVNFTSTRFPSRLAYSDQKIYNTSEQGFDIFRVLNIYDLEERYGSITKLSLAGDKLYAIQERGITYLPTGQSQLEQTDAGILSVGTGDVIGRTIIIDDKRGGQHLRGIIETGNEIYIPDVENKAVYSLSNDGLSIISDINVASLFREKFESPIEEKNLIGIYDAVKKEYWLADNSAHWCHRFDGKGAWRGNYEFGVNGSLQGGSVGDQTLFLLGKVGDQVSVFSMYTGDAGQLMGQEVTPRVSFVVNPDSGFSKTFDNMMFVADGDLATVDFLVERPDGNSQNVTGTVIAGYKEGNYRIKSSRDSSGARLRGLQMITTVKWTPTTDIVSQIGRASCRERV